MLVISFLLTFALLIATFILVAKKSKNVVKTVSAVGVNAAISLPVWYFYPWLAPWVALGIMTWAVVFAPKFKNILPVMALWLFVGQLPLLIVTFYRFATANNFRTEIPALVIAAINGILALLAGRYISYD